MKKLFLLFLLSNLVYTSGNACTFISDPFCKTSTLKPDDVILSGKIVGINADGIDLEIIDLIRGEEDRTVIRIWDGTDFDCNGIFSMAAGDLGVLNDSIVLILPKIDSLENSWDVMGDYRRPGYFGYTTSLQWKNDVIFGPVTGDPIFPLMEVSYSSLLDSWETYGDCSDISVSVSELDNEAIIVSYTNPVQTQLSLSFTAAVSDRLIEVYSMNGVQLVQVQNPAEQVRLNLSRFANGLYYIRIIEERKKQEVFKIVKQ